MLDIFGAPCIEIEEVPRLQMVVIVKLEQRAVQLVGPGFGSDGHRGPTGQPLFRVERRSGDVDGFDRFRGRRVDDVVRQEGKNYGCSVDTRDIRTTASPVYVENESASRCIGHGVGKARWLCAGNQVDGALEIAITGQRELADCVSAEGVLQIWA